MSIHTLVIRMRDELYLYIYINSINEKRTPPNTLSLHKQKDASNIINKEIQHIQGDLNDDLYAVPMKNNAHELADVLPVGWEKHEGTRTADEYQ